MSCRKDQYRDLDKYRKTRMNQKRRYRLRTGSGLYKRRAWTDEEDRLVISHEIADVDLSVLIKRSVQAIQVRRNRIKLEVVE